MNFFELIIVVLGSKDIDHLRIVELCRCALRFVSSDADTSRRIQLSDTAVFICKIWDGELKSELMEEVGQIFGKVSVVKPDASRDNSAEIFIYSKRIKNG